MPQLNLRPLPSVSQPWGDGCLFTYRTTQRLSWKTKKATQLWSLGAIEDSAQSLALPLSSFPKLSVLEFYPLAPFCL